MSRLVPRFPSARKTKAKPQRPRSYKLGPTQRCGRNLANDMGTCSRLKGHDGPHTNATSKRLRESGL